MKVEASAPSNIALIKYMGKTAAQGNLPTNASLSYAAEHLRTFVTIEDGTGEDGWQPLEGFPVLQLSEFGQQKFLNHFRRLKKHWGIEGSHTVRSANNFPSDCGLASSASSFAALTLATRQLTPQSVSLDELSRLSRQGSGSSCRSFFSPWALWRGEGAEALALPVQLEHAAILIGVGKKAVSTSEAHQRVASSALFAGRPERAERRLQALIASLQEGRWADSFELCWSEFWDMHVLFETSTPCFGYMTDESLKVLNHLRGIWRATGDGPLVTMDAGANVHVFVRPDQVRAADGWLADWQAVKSWANHV